MKRSIYSTDQTRKLTIAKNSWGEYVVRVHDLIRGVIDATYHTDDKQDAIDTRNTILKDYESGNGYSKVRL